LGRVRVTAPSGARISLGVAQGAASPLSTHLAPGTYEVVAVLADGHELRQHVVVRAGASEEVPFQAPTPVAPARPTDSVEKPRVVLHGGVPVLGIAVSSLTVVLAGTAVGLGVGAVQARDAYNASNHTDAAAYNRAAALRTWTNVAWFSAAGFGI